MPAPSRVVDYFAVLRASTERTTNTERFQQRGVRVVPSIRYPFQDHHDCEFPKDFGAFAYPDGAFFAGTKPHPIQYSFVLTEADGSRVYCSALRFYREINAQTLKLYNELGYQIPSDNGQCYEPIALILSSHWPFYEQFDRILHVLFQITEINSVKLPFPIEKLLQNLIMETPLPPLGRRIVQFDLFDEKIEFLRPPPNQLPLHGHNLDTLFHVLSMANIVTLIGAILCEKRVLLYSKNISLLTPCIEGLTTLVYPFYWQHIYVPVLPSKFIDFISAPMPFICGVLPDYMPDLQTLEGVIFVNLDDNSISHHKNDPIPAFPRQKLDRYSGRLIKDTTQPLKMGVKIEEDKVRDAFIRFYAKFFRGYKNYMNPSTGFSKDKFNKEKWINDNCPNSENRKFFEMFVEAQMFQCFIDERFEASGNSYEVLYFDEKIDETSGKVTPFLNDTTFMWDRQNPYVVPKPIAEKGKEIVYKDGFPLGLDPLLFGDIRPPETLVTEKDLIEQPTMHISWMSVEFFKKKRIYDRHWHSLDARIESQNVIFEEVSAFLTRWQSVTYEHVSNLAKLLQAFSYSLPTTKTSIDNPWEQCRKSYQNMSKLADESFYHCKKVCAVPLIENIHTTESMLKVLFEAARECERRTATRKCDVEFTNKARTKFIRLADVETNDPQKDTANNQRHLTNVITALENKDQAEIEHMESTTTFLTNLDIFTEAMPQMIREVKKYSGDRIKLFKDHMLGFASNQQKLHQAFANEFAEMCRSLQQVSPESDINTFSEGNDIPKNSEDTIDVNTTGKTNTSTNNNNTSTDKKVDDTEKRYSLSKELSYIQSAKVNNLSILGLQDTLASGPQRPNRASGSGVNGLNGMQILVGQIKAEKHNDGESSEDSFSDKRDKDLIMATSFEIQKAHILTLTPTSGPVNLNGNNSKSDADKENDINMPDLVLAPISETNDAEIGNNTDPSTAASINKDANKNGIVEKEMTKADTNKDNIVKDSAVKDDTAVKDDVVKDDVVKDDVVKDDVVKEDIVKDNAAKDDATKDNTVKDNIVVKDDTAVKDDKVVKDDKAVRDDTIKDDTIKDATITNTIIKVDTVKDDVVKDSEIRKSEIKDDEAKISEVKGGEMKNNETKESETKENELKKEAADFTRATSVHWDVDLKNVRGRLRSEVQISKRGAATSANGVKNISLSPETPVGKDTVELNLPQEIKPRAVSLLIPSANLKKHEGRVSVNYYADNLWGPSGFETVLKQGEDGRTQIKQVNKALEDLSLVWDGYSKKLQTCLTQMKPFLQSTKCEQRYWSQLRTLTEAQCNAYRICGAEIKDICTPLKILKGELRNVTRILQRKKGELTSEVQFATRNVEQCYDERVACLKLFRNAQNAWKQSVQQTSAEDTLRPLLVQMKETEYNYRRSDEKWETSKQLLKAVRKKEDICNGVILDTFRTKEVERQYQLIKAFAQVVEILFIAIIKVNKTNEQLFESADAIRSDEEIDKFILNCYKTVNSKTDQDRPTAVTDPGIKWNDRSVQMAWTYNDRGGNALKFMTDFYNSRNVVEEDVSKQYTKKKQEWGTSLAAKYGYAMNDVVQVFVDTVTTLSKVSNDMCAQIHHEIETQLTDAKNKLKDFQTATQNLVSECYIEYNHLETNLTKSKVEVGKLKTIVATLEHKLQQRTEKKKDNEIRRGLKFFRKSTEQLQRELKLNKDKLAVEEQNRDILQVQLQQKSNYRDMLHAKVITDFIKHEHYRINMIRNTALKYVMFAETQCIALDKALQTFRNRARSFHVDENITAFVEQNRSNVKAPKIVLDHTTFKLEESSKEDLTSMQTMDVVNLKLLNKFAHGVIRKRIVEETVATSVQILPTIEMYNNQTIQEHAIELIQSYQTQSSVSPFLLPQSQSQALLIGGAENDKEELKTEDSKRNETLPSVSTFENQNEPERSPDMSLSQSEDKLIPINSTNNTIESNTNEINTIESNTNEKGREP